jgi:hypothetical protein
VKVGGRAPPAPSPARADFSIMIGCMPEIGNRHSMRTLRSELTDEIYGNTYFLCLNRDITAGRETRHEHTHRLGQGAKAERRVGRSLRHPRRPSSHTGTEDRGVSWTV